VSSSLVKRNALIANPARLNPGPSARWNTNLKSKVLFRFSHAWHRRQSMSRVYSRMTFGTGIGLGNCLCFLMNAVSIRWRGWDSLGGEWLVIEPIRAYSASRSNTSWERGRTPLQLHRPGCLSDSTLSVKPCFRYHELPLPAPIPANLFFSSPARPEL